MRLQFAICHGKSVMTPPAFGILIVHDVALLEVHATDTYEPKVVEFGFTVRLLITGSGVFAAGL